MRHSMLLIAAGAAAALLAAACSTTPPRSEPIACENLGPALASLGNVRVTGAKAVAADDKGAPAHCQVSGVANERTGSDGRRYAIGFEMRLPAQWQGRFLHQVNGGNDGKIVPALGTLQVHAQPALARGFAVISSDSGHRDDDPANDATGLAKGNVFGLDPQARRDYGYSANDTMYTVAQALMRAHYGRAPAHNYIAGCSNGGRHALVAATRYGNRYHGVLAGAPGLNLPKAAVQHAWDVQSWQLADADIRKAFSPADMQLVAAKVVEKCDAIDGAADGIVADIPRCQTAFNLSELQCRGEKTAACLSPSQVQGLKRSFAGPRNSRGEALYSDWSWDAGVGATNWRFWKMESQIPPWDRLPLIATMGSGSLAYIFTTPPTRTAGNPNALLGFLSGFNFDRDAPRINATDATYTESGMTFMTPPDVSDPKVETFRARGGKMIVYHGVSDAVFSANDTARWFAKLQANTAGAPFARYYPVSGMAHCANGPATDRFDPLGALVDWVEGGKAPAALTAGVNAENKELPANWSKTRTRPLCPYPQVARYKGGDMEAAASFKCEAP